MAEMYFGACAERRRPAQPCSKPLIKRLFLFARGAGTAIAESRVNTGNIETEDVMNALLRNVVIGNGGVAVARYKAPVIWMPRRGGIGNVARAVAAPFIGLVFIVAFPIVGLGMLAWMGARALARRAERVTRVAKNIALFVAAPFIGLAYAVAFPFIGVGMLAWWCVRALAKR